MTQPRKITDLDLFEARVLATASSWTAFVQVRPGDRRRLEAETQEGAITLARSLSTETGRRVLIYACTLEGRSVQAGYVTVAGDFVSSVRQPEA